MSNISISITGELTYKTGCNFILISTQNIMYAEYQDEVCTIVLSDGVKHIICCSLKELLTYLPSYFISISRNTMINLKFIKSIHKSHIVLHPEIVIEISTRKHRMLIKKMLINEKYTENTVLRKNAYPLKLNAYP